MAFASPTPPDALAELFGIRLNPTVGELSFQTGSKTEKITFGTSTGFYAIGFAFPAELMPEPYQSRYRGSEAISVLLGNATPGEKVAQFGSLILFTQSARINAELRVPAHSDPHSTRAALIRFLSPASAANQNDEDRLKSTFFASEGTAKLIPGIVTSMAVAFSDRRLRFKKGRIRIEMDTKMATPFNPLSGNLKGRLDLAVFSPDADESRRLLKEALFDSLRSPLTPENIPTRAISGK